MKEYKMNQRFKERKENLEKLYCEKKLNDFEYNNLIFLNNIMGYLIDIDKRAVIIEGELEGIKSNIELLASKEI